MAVVFLFVVRFLSFYTILYRSVFAYSLNVCTVDSADVGLQSDYHIVRSSCDLPAKFTGCVFDHSRVILVRVTRIVSGLFTPWQPLLWPQSSSAPRLSCLKPAISVRGVVSVSLLLLAGDVESNPGPVTHVNTPDWVNIGCLNCCSASGSRFNS